MSDALGYRLIDEPKLGALQRFGMPPLLVFLVGNFFLPWSWLLVALNAVLLGGPNRNREIALSFAAIVIYWLGIFTLDALIAEQVIQVSAARYAFVIVISAGLCCAAWAYVSQERTWQLRKYLSQR